MEKLTISDLTDQQPAELGFGREGWIGHSKTRLAGELVLTGISIGEEAEYGPAESIRILRPTLTESLPEDFFRYVDDEASYPLCLALDGFTVKNLRFNYVDGRDSFVFSVPLIELAGLDQVPLDRSLLQERTFLSTMVAILERYRLETLLVEELRISA